MVRGVVSTAGRHNFSGRNAYLVLTRCQQPGEGFMRWQPLSRMGWRVVCLSQLDAHECVLMVGGYAYPRPSPVMDDDEYERWLLRTHFRVQPYEVTGKGEVTFLEWHRGWVPGLDELRTGQSSPAIVWREYEDRRSNLLAVG